MPLTDNINKYVGVLPRSYFLVEFDSKFKLFDNTKPDINYLLNR